MMRLLKFLLMTLSLLFILHCSETKKPSQMETETPQAENVVPQIDSTEAVTEDSLTSGLEQPSEDKQ